MTYLLHISDLHLVVDPQWNNMKNAILYSVRKKLSNVPRGQKLLVITGDFHNFVQNNYNQAKQFVGRLITAMDIEADKDVFVIPGNHDISGVKKTASGKDDKAVYIQAIKSNPSMLHDNIEKLIQYYDEYIDLVRSMNIYPMDCEKLPVRVHVRTWRNKLHLLHLNTVLIADGSMKNMQMVDILSATSDEIREQLRLNNLPCIAIGHNSFFDLLDAHQSSLSAMFLQENVSAYLCGDRHQRNSIRPENRIVLSNKISSVTIPNIVSYRSSTDENDKYSDFGMIWHIWDEQTDHVKLEFMSWDPRDQGELQPDGEDFYDFRKVPSAFSAGYVNNNSCWLSNDYLLKRHTEPLKSTQVKNFLLGGRCGWNLAFSDKIVTRDIVEKLYNDVMEGGVYALVGPGGEGKSTILKQLCARLVLNGETVFYYRGYGALKLPAYVSDNAVFVLDNPPDKMEFKYFLNEVLESGQTLVIGARQNEWNLLKGTLKISDRDVRDISLPTLTAKESWHFADCVCNNLHCSKNKKEIKELFQNNAYGFLYAAMLMVANNKSSLEDIAHKIIGNLNERSPKALILLAHIVLSEWYNVKFTRIQMKEVCNLLELVPQKAAGALSREVSLNGDVYQTRHEIISKLFYKELFSDSGILLFEKMDDILGNLLEFQLQYCQAASSNRKLEAWNSTMRLLGGLSQTSQDTQKYLINRILDEMKAQPPKNIEQIPSYIKDEDVQMLFYRQCFEREFIFSDFLLKWCQLLLKNGSVWSISDPYSPAWILRNACISGNAESSVWRAWAHFEAEENGAGDYGRPNTARWIYREGCINHNMNSDSWLAWAQLEAQQGRIGDYESENTARWIYREGCINYNINSDMWLAWAQLETQQGQVGDYESENTARWIYREACMNHNGNSAVWIAWAQLEIQENQIGDYESENTARWIYREACMNRNADSNTWRAWGQLEIQENRIGDYGSENTARWIYREACMNHNGNSAAWRAWGQLETQENQIGDYGSENTARWIYREACMNRNADSNTWLAWAQLEVQQGQIGDYGSENTARWIYREACIKRDVNGHIWAAWGQLETQEGRIGDCESENTAKWIYAEGIKRFPNVASLYSACAYMELLQGCIGQARNILRQSLQYSDFSIGSLAIIEFFCGNIDSGDCFCVNQLLKRMEKGTERSLKALLYLYYCSLLLERTEDAERYYGRLLQKEDYNPMNNTYVEEFIRLCRNASK